MRIELQDYYAVAARRSKDVAQTVSALARERIGGLQSIAAEPPKPRGDAGRPSLGHRVRATLRRFLARNQISFDWLDAGRARGWPRSGSARPPARRRARSVRLADGEVIERPRRRAISRERLGPADQAARRRVRRRDRRRRPGRPRRRGLRRVRGPADDRRRARGAGRAGRHLVADRELPRLPERHLRRRAGQPRAAAGAAARRRDPGHPLGRAASTRRPTRSSSTAARRSAARSLILATGVTLAAARRSRASTG